MLGKLVAYLIRSVALRLMIAGAFLLILRFGPWGNVFQFAGLFPGDANRTASHEFAQVAEALNSGADPSQGFDPIHGFTDENPTVRYRPPRNSGGSGSGSGGDDEGLFRALARKLGFKDRAVEAPEWVPVFPGTIDKGTILQSTPEGQKRVIRGAVPATGRSVASFYERSFERMGYEATSEETGDGKTFAANSADGKRFVTVAISARGARSTLALTHWENLHAAGAAGDEAAGGEAAGE